MRKIVTGPLCVAAFAMTAGSLAASAPAYARSDTDAYQLMQNMAHCMVAGQPDKARALLATAPFSDAADATMRSFAAERSRCLKVVGGGGKLKMKSQSFRGALAEQLYLITYPAPPAPLATDAEPAPFQGSGDPRLASYDVSRCAALRNPVVADAFVRSKLKSDEEKGALKALLPVIGSCTPKGAKIGFDREMLHGLMAEAIWAERSGAAG